MDREQLIERAYAKTDLDFDQIEGLTDSQLRELLGLNAEPVKPEKPPRIESPKIKPLMIGYEFTEHEGALYRLETWRMGDAEQRVRVKCANTVKFEGRSVSASIVLHWLRTGELVRRVPRERKTWQAAIRENGKVKHLGRFATKEQRDAVVLMYRLNKTIDPVD
jgi:hypothetical protein